MLFLAVWLKRQEADAHRTRILAQGLADVTGALQGKSNVADIYKVFVQALFPFQVATQESADEKMKEMLQKQTAKGVLTFKPVSMDFLHKKAKQVSVPDDFAKKLAERRKATKP